MKEYLIGEHGTKVVLKKGRIENEEADLILNWSNPDMRSGPGSFYKIHQVAGPSLFDYIIGTDEIMRETDCVSTLPGMLNCKLVLHSIIPTGDKRQYLRCLYNIVETIKTYKKDNLCDSIALYIPEEPGILLGGIYSFLFDIGLKEVRVMYLNESEFEQLDSFFKKHRKKEKTWQLMDRWIIKTMVRLGEVKIFSGRSLAAESSRQ